jgi:hypothetical protein
MERVLLGLQHIGSFDGTDGIRSPAMETERVPPARNVIGE